MPRKQRLKRSHLFVLAMVLMIAGGVWLAWQRERSLLDQAHRVVGLAEITDVQAYDWVSEHELLIVTRHPQNKPDWKFTVQLFDTVTKTYTPLAGLAKTLTDKKTWPNDFKMSPNRTWLYWVNRSDTSWTEFAASRLDGTQYRTWVRYGFNKLFFTDDGHIAQLASNPPWVAIRDLSDARRDRVFAYPGTTAKQILANHAADHPRFVVAEPVWHPDDTASAYISSYRFLDYIPLYTNWQSDQGSSVAPIATAIWPANTSFTGCEVSPYERKVVISTRCERPDKLLTTIHRIIPSVKVPSRRWESIWIWNGENTEMRELGRMPGKELYDDKFATNVGNVNWLPGDRQISFEYKHKLYVLNVDVIN